MSPDAPAGPLVVILLSAAVAVCTLSCLGLLVMKGFYNKLHYLAPPAILGTAAVAAAIAVQEGLGPTMIKGVLVFLVMLITNPILTFAAARAKYLRDLQVPDEERGPGRGMPVVPSDMGGKAPAPREQTDGKA